MKKSTKLRAVSTILTMTLVFLCIPGIVLAAPDAYGFNAQANCFQGTMANWENLMYGRPSEPNSFAALDTEFLIRKWDVNFNNIMFNGGPFVDGAWQQAHIYKYPSDKPGWVWNVKFKMVYSSNPVPGALAVEGMPGFYIVQYKEWFTDPQNNEHIVESNLSIPPALGSGFYY